MKTCNDITKHLDALLAAELPAAEAEACRSHIAGCEQCAQRLAMARAIQDQLSVMPYEAMSPAFAARALEQAGGETTHAQRRKTFLAGFSSAIAASFALWLVVAGIFEGENSDTLPQITMSVHETKYVNVVFNSPDAFSGADMSLQLQGSFELVGYPGQRELQWQTNIVKGKNLLRLPVQATENGVGTLIATVGHGGQERTFRIRLDATGEGLGQTTPSAILV